MWSERKGGNRAMGELRPKFQNPQKEIATNKSIHNVSFRDFNLLEVFHLKDQLVITQTLTYIL